MYKYVISNEKGGVAKTTTTINVAAGMARLGKTVLVVDMDAQASATSVLVGHKQAEVNIYHLLKDQKHQIPVDTAIQETSEPGVFIIPGGPQLANAEVEFIKYIDNQRLLLNRLQEVDAAYSFDFVVVDSPPRSILLNRNCLFAADEVIIPVFTDLFSIEGIVDLTDDIGLIAQSRGKKIDIGFLLCRVERTKSAQQISQELREVYGHHVFHTMIPKNVDVSDAHGAHVSVLTYAPASTGAVAYQQLAQEILTRYDQQAVTHA